MKPRMILSLLVVISLFELSCGSVGPIMTTTGERATIQLRDQSEQSVELIAIGDSSIICSAASSQGTSISVRTQEIHLENIAQITVSGFRNDKWWIGVVCTEVIPAAGIAIAASSAGSSDVGAVFAVSLIPAVITTILYATSGVPTPAFTSPLSSKDLDELRKYARFGGKLTATQTAQLLEANPKLGNR